jgi:hypothetical protein
MQVIDKTKVDLAKQSERLKKAHVFLLRHDKVIALSGIIVMGKSEVVENVPTAYTGYQFAMLWCPKKSAWSGGTQTFMASKCSPKVSTQGLLSCSSLWVAAELGFHVWVNT